MLRQMYPSPFLPHSARALPEMQNPFRNLLRPSTPHPFLIDPLAFAVALLLAPVVVAIFGFWALLIPVFAIFLGGPLYLVIGVPLLLWHIPRHGVNVGRIAFLAFKADLVVVIAAAVWVLFLAPRPAWDSFSFLAVCSLVMAPIWAAVFADLYKRFQRQAYQKWND